MNHEQMNALRRVLEHFGHDDIKHYEEAGKPPGHIAEALLALDQYREAQSKGYRDDDADDPTTASALGIVRDDPSPTEGWATEHDIIWKLLSLAKLPTEIDNFVRAAVIQKMPVDLRAPVIAVLETIKKERDPGEEIPF